MHNDHKAFCKNLSEVAKLIKESGYNGCHYCLPRYDTDTLTTEKVLKNLEEDLQKIQLGQTLLIEHCINDSVMRSI